MKIIGLTGGIGSGKSTVARFLAEMGAAVIDADRVGHESLRPGSEGCQQVAGAFDSQVVSPQGDIDRPKLGKLVFGDPAALERLNRILHPLIFNMVKDKLEEYRRRGTGVVVLEAPLLVEAGWKTLVDEVWVTTASEVTVLKRLRERTGMSEQESLARIRSQLSPAERARQADVIIDTDCSLDELEARVKRLWQRLGKNL